jgi:hypothetical protein
VRRTGKLLPGRSRPIRLQRRSSRFGKFRAAKRPARTTPPVCSHFRGVSQRRFFDSDARALKRKCTPSQLGGQGWRRARARVIPCRT